jgi:hypothetical protein
MVVTGGVHRCWVCPSEKALFHSLLSFSFLSPHNAKGRERFLLDQIPRYISFSAKMKILCTFKNNDPK